MFCGHVEEEDCVLRKCVRERDENESDGGWELRLLIRSSTRLLLLGVRSASCRPALLRMTARTRGRS